ncbi:hypothetical protein FDC26_17655 [Clostridium botulinum]|uniref:Holliday junction resolvase RecU n=1 Tax=unclassified Clostridium TaxID=2614128 RepID=UPI0013C69A7E|nr:MULTISPECIES: Holliday junction resolvase RecU [unclassified Clostridium]NFN78664.1 hypothetical protein [Clostridium botulinum]NFO78858.1 hypothetical protein [Clostridium botulinum]NFP05740.1 hypothetical protein [Clostridium botulinum]NFS02255.1 hypothetical protein [Clostridium botulinum]NFT97344.1 hypothetical protein [Clostridium botulinum]
MAKNSGKIFEEDIKNSIPKNQDFFYYRFIDNAASFSGGDNVRFTSHNLCDCMTMTKDKLYLMELKTHTGASLPLSCIRKNQIDGMAKINHPNMKAIFIINFREKEKTYAIEADKLEKYIQTSKRKSIPISFLEEYGVEIIGTKKKVHYRYDLEKYFEEDNDNE